jgi:hypothetical protein
MLQQVTTINQAPITVLYANNFSMPKNVVEIKGAAFISSMCEG